MNGPGLTRRSVQDKVLPGKTNCDGVQCMRTRSTVTISLPPDMMRQFEKVRKAEQRNKSELVREALRVYFSRIPTVTATAGELRAIARGRAELARGEFVRLDQLDAMGRPHRQVRRKKPRARSGR